MTWEQVKLALSKKLNDPSGVRYGGILKDYFRSAYNQYVPKAPIEQLYLLQTVVSLPLSSGIGEYDIPKCGQFINISAPNYSVDSKVKRYMEVSPANFALSISNPLLAPTDEEVKWYRDNNKIKILSDNVILKFNFNYLPELDFDNLDNNISDNAISIIMDIVVSMLMPKGNNNESTDTNK